MQALSAPPLSPGRSTGGYAKVLLEEGDVTRDGLSRRDGEAPHTSGGPGALGGWGRVMESRIVGESDGTRSGTQGTALSRPACHALSACLPGRPCFEERVRYLRVRFRETPQQACPCLPLSAEAPWPKSFSETEQGTGQWTPWVACMLRAR